MFQAAFQKLTIVIQLAVFQKPADLKISQYHPLCSLLIRNIVQDYSSIFKI